MSWSLELHYYSSFGAPLLLLLWGYVMTPLLEVHYNTPPPTRSYPTSSHDAAPIPPPLAATQYPPYL